MEKDDKRIPEQKTGASSNVGHSVDAKNRQEAERIYNGAKANLLNINRWHEFAGKLSATFQLTDVNSARPVQRPPAPGDYISIHLPTSSEDKLDWVRIEKIEENEPEHGDRSLLIQVRPTDPPDVNKETEHFFSDDATSSFIVELKDTIVSAMVCGRNELPNTEAEGLTDKIRNVAIAIGAMLGLNAPQWKALTKGLIENA